MKDKKNWLTEQEFTAACAALPLVSIDFVVLSKNMKILLGKRRNTPAKDFFFTPGGRVRKNESHIDAIQRISQMELNVSSCSAQSLQMMGVWDHFYQESAFNSKISTHYVNIPYFWIWDGNQGAFAENLPKDQHSEWLWMSPKEILVSDKVHEYVKLYAEWVLNFLKDDFEKK